MFLFLKVHPLLGAGEVAQWLLAAAALSEDLCSDPRAHVRWLLKLKLGASDAVFWPVQETTYSYF